MDTPHPVVALQCSQCGLGFYVTAAAGWRCTNRACRHIVTTRDIVLDPGETLTTNARGHLAVNTEGAV